MHLTCIATFPRVRPADDPVADGTEPLKASSLTFPRLTVSRAAGSVDVEVGYRKLGVWHYEGAAKGRTHSNAGQLTVAWRAPAARGWAFGVRGGVQLIRTVTIVSTAPASWPIRSGVNTFQWRPVAAATASYDITPHWGVAAEWEPVLGVLGRRGVSDRYRQQLLGLDLVYRR